MTTDTPRWVRYTMVGFAVFVAALIGLMVFVVVTLTDADVPAVKPAAGGRVGPG